jgi:hypothetical protein
MTCAWSLLAIEFVFQFGFGFSIWIWIWIWIWFFNLDLDLDFDLTIYSDSRNGFEPTTQRMKTMMNMNSFKQDFTKLAMTFPHYDVGTLPPIPIHWEDSHYHHDASPSYVTGAFHIFIQPLALEDREYDFPFRFVVMTNNGTEIPLVTNDWTEVLNLVSRKGVKK